MAGIPDPIPGEPPDLRRAILDEIEDHLRCATQRELRRAHSTGSAFDRDADQPSDLAAGGASGGAPDPASDSSSDPDLDSARRRALDRFGDPAAIARRLWFDAMKGQLETIMTNRILIGFNIVLLLAVLVLGGLLVVMVRDGRAFHRELVERMMAQEASAREAREAARVGASYDWPSVDFEVTDEDSGAPVSDVTVVLYGPASGTGRAALLQGTTDANGVTRLGPMRPGDYYAALERDGRTPILLERLTVQPGPENRRSVQWPSKPDPALIPVMVDVTWPESITDAGAVLVTRLWPSEQLGDGRSREHPPLDLAVRRDGAVALLIEKSTGGHPFPPFRYRGRAPRLPSSFSTLAPEWGESIPMLEGVPYRTESVMVFAPASETGSYTQLHDVEGGEGFDSDWLVARDQPLTFTLVSPESAEAGRR